MLEKLQLILVYLILLLENNPVFVYLRKYDISRVWVYRSHYGIWLLGLFV